MSNELSESELFAGRVAIAKQIERLVKQEKEEMREGIRDAGMRSLPVFADSGELLGEGKVTYSKPKPVIIDQADAIEFLRERGLTVEVPVKDWEKHFAKSGDYVICTDDGEICTALGWQGRTPGSIRFDGFDFDTVMNALQPKLGGNVSKLLGGM